MAKRLAAIQRVRRMKTGAHSMLTDLTRFAILTNCVRRNDAHNLRWIRYF